MRGRDIEERGGAMVGIADDERGPEGAGARDKVAGGVASAGRYGGSSSMELLIGIGPEMVLLDSLWRVLARRAIDRKEFLSPFKRMDWPEAMLDREEKEDRWGRAPG
jgi:hypothetical protein